MSLNETILAQIKVATEGLRQRGPGLATAAIRKTLASQMPTSTMPTCGLKGGTPNFVSDILSQLGVTPPLDVAVARRNSGASADPGLHSTNPSMPERGAPGQFLTRSFTDHAGTRSYKLYIPSSYSGQSMPLMVMLHGCTQHPDDFAQGTRMNIVAEERQCFVVYPAQTQAANSSKCWNWFKTEDQQRGRGEPAIIAGITQEVIDAYQLDAKKVYVAGLSAGGAMAVIMGTTYPELYAAVGVHSGLPYAAAHDLPSAFSAMQGNSQGMRKRANHAGPDLRSMPMIVFHGDSDSTVSASNGERLMEQVAPSTIVQQDGTADGGRRYTRTSHHHEGEAAHAEHWVIHGAGHAWAGGSMQGSHTDATGPDASREMMRFFYTQP